MIKKIAVLMAALTAVFSVSCSDNAGTSAASSQTSLNGAGASFPAPVYQSWAYTYTQAGKGKINYQSLGSGAGINQIKAGTIDFAGSDNPLTLKEQTENHLIQFPMLTGGVVLIVNIPGVPANSLRLSREALADIFLGKITNWNHEKIQKDNPSIKLPDLPVTVVHRADASGTTFIFTNYLSKISKEWNERAGFGSSVEWPAVIGGQKNPGVCNNVAKIKGSIGYTEYTYAVEAKLSTVILENQTGNFVAPSQKTFQASSANADWANAEGFYMILTDQPGEDTWPITGITYILMRSDCPESQKKALVQYFNWCFSSDAGAIASKLHYVPIPENVVKLIQEKYLK